MLYNASVKATERKHSTVGSCSENEKFLWNLTPTDPKLKMARRREKIFKKISTHTKISLKLKKITKKDNHENIFKKQTNKTKPKTPLKKKNFTKSSTAKRKKTLAGVIRRWLTTLCLTESKEILEAEFHNATQLTRPEENMWNCRSVLRPGDGRKNRAAPDVENIIWSLGKQTVQLRSKWFQVNAERIGKVKR